MRASSRKLGALFLFQDPPTRPGAAPGKPSSTGINMRQAKTLGNDERFQQLLALADEGDESARADLFREYGHEYGHGISEVRHER